MKKYVSFIKYLFCPVLSTPGMSKASQFCSFILLYCRTKNRNSYKLPFFVILNVLIYVNTKYLSRILYFLNYSRVHNIKNFRINFLLEKPYVCDVCFRRYSWKRGLMQHKQYSCGKEPQFLCPLEGCDYRARIKGNVKKHYERMHFQKETVNWNSYFDFI